ncbi:MAG: chemotaxis protein CheR [Planctomycetes bacterium]|nr:chemotaxis protein CheR [Planctomycetota bacterium]
MIDSQCVEFLQWALPRLQLRWPGFRKVRKQVCKRVTRRIEELGLADVGGYRTYLEATPEEWATLDTFCRIPISRFYRDRGVFDLLRDEVLPELAVVIRQEGGHELRCWSAGCASGEEVYTLSAIWQLSAGLAHPDITWRVLATDNEPEMLARARRGCYSASSLKELPREWLPAVFTPENGLLCVKPAFRSDIDFTLQDIRTEMPEGTFHLVLCRHMAFTYFDEPLQREVLQRILAKLVRGGVLVTGKQEPLPAQPPELEECQPRMGVYRKRSAQ